jgi:phospholipid/cholesterol/gamma-HCH transport system substrate-binding protein
MEDRSLKIQIGLFVVAAIAVLVFLVFLNSEGFRRQYTVYIKPQTAPGVTKDTPIRKNGILIGRVGSVKSEDDHVVLMLRINADEAVYSNDVCSIGTDSFLGDSVVEIIPLKAEERGVPLANGGALTTVNIRRNPLEIVDVVMKLESKASDTMTAMQKASDQVAEAGAGIRNLTEQVQDAIGSNDSDFKKLIDNVQQTSKKAQLALDNFNKLFEGINEVVGTQEFKDQLRDAIRKVPEVFDELRTTIADTRETINTFREVSASAKKNLENLEPLSDAVREHGADIVKQVQSSLQNIDELMAEAKRFSEVLAKVNRGEGTLGKLVNDPELYNNVNSAAKNIRRMTVQLEPLIGDIRMFADSLARDPSVLVKGALNKNPPGSGYKGTTAGQGRSGLR